MGKATRASFGETIAALGDKHPGLVVLDADLGKSTQTGAFMKKYPDRYFEFGIAEQNMIGTAAGMALCGKTPVTTSFSAFLITRLETIRVAVSYNKTNVKLVGTHAGIGIGDDGTSQMGLEDVGAMRSLPHMTILQPADHREACQAVEWMIEHEGPVYIRLTRQKMADVHPEDYEFEVGKCSTLYEPEDAPAKVQATIFASGGPVPHALQAAKDLKERGFAARVVNAGTLLPFDQDAVVEAAEKSQRIVTVEDHNINGGLGSAVAEVLAERGKACPLVRLGLRDFGESGEGEELYEKYGLSANHIAEAAIRNLD
jgi:transketolase